MYLLLLKFTANTVKLIDNSFEEGSITLVWGREYCSIHNHKDLPLLSGESEQQCFRRSIVNLFLQFPCLILQQVCREFDLDWHGLLPEH